MLPKMGEIRSGSGSRRSIRPSRARVAVAIAKLEQGTLSNVRPVGAGVLEFRIDFGPGYRVCFGRYGDVLVIVLTGGTKKRQQRDIDAAIVLWDSDKRRKRANR
jgi:putative addiction module killer protein